MGATRRRRAGAVAAALAAALFAGCATEPREPMTTPDEDWRSVDLTVLDLGEQTLALVPVIIGDAGPHLFVLDTGASMTVLDEGLAGELGLPPTGRERPVSGVLGQQQATTVRVDRWRLGDIPLDAAEIATIDLPDTGSGTELRGLLGSDVLSRFGQIVVDYDADKLGLPAEG
ncbi:Aspartyl protease [Amycolatopsis arida]|uniref:Aspartyl protease n=1 Tax=Amycolatopsis arida TaxID=587909 RepID=A0A1I5LIA2_9PSEU|nr:retropepsin-like aspartic protease [Amycolatopsis arida]TDX93732.1 aspartyl protease [Amycolatopsis arida]SFO97038.1 Aspartyl protease [Amycolatopsis arida]